MHICMLANCLNSSKKLKAPRVRSLFTTDLLSSSIAPLSVCRLILSPPSHTHTARSHTHTHTNCTLWLARCGVCGVGWTQPFSDRAATLRGQKPQLEEENTGVGNTLFSTGAGAPFDWPHELNSMVPSCAWNRCWILRTSTRVVATSHRYKSPHDISSQA